MRQVWIDEAKSDAAEYARREQSDFLAEKNHEGEIADFHSLRHTCGAWLAMAGAHPKAVQTIMRHSAITLTMDTYGHLFPGQEFETVSLLPTMLGMVQGAVHAQYSCGETGQSVTTHGDALRDGKKESRRRKSLLSSALGDSRRVLTAAEGTGLEPATACAATDFESVC